MLDPVERYEHAGLTVSIYQDDDARNPQREFDNLGTMVGFPSLTRHWDLADRESTGTEDEAFDRRPGLLERYLRLTEGAEVVFYYFADYGSGGARLYDTVDDGHASGFFVVDRATIVKEYGDDSAESREKARSVLTGEIKQMGMYVEGDVYGYVISSEDDDHLDSCWGFYGGLDPDDHICQEANSAAEWVARDRGLDLEPDLETAIYEETR